MINKYRVVLTDYQELELPAEAVFLAAMYLDGKIELFVQEDRSLPLTKRSIAIYATGTPEDVTDNWYIGSVLSDRSGQVWHVFEVF